MKVKQTLSTAARLVTGPRAKSHGTDLKESLQVTADLWSAYLRRPLTADDAAMMLSLLKIGRTVTGQKKPDHYVDGSAYIAIAGEIRD